MPSINAQSQAPIVVRPRGVELLQAMQGKGPGGLNKVGLTERSDFLLSKDTLTLTKAGSGAIALAQAKLTAANNRRDDLIVTADQDVYVASSAAFKVATGTMPAAGENITLVDAQGNYVDGKVAQIDAEGQAFAAQEATRQSEAAANEQLRRQQNARAARRGAAVGLGVLILGGAVAYGAAKQGMR